ncbi:MAG: phosphoribosylaminoimidazolesuccinocarboxamide synthase [Veillonella sp.]|nr:phosphoribosylaminoimidazolesuccinocarboxamide synthase [Veillonella sp.]
MKVGIIMGSKSDLDTMKKASTVLDEFNIPYEMVIASAHRTPEAVKNFVTRLEGEGAIAFIAGAGAAAHLPGVVASFTTLPVIGIPLNATALKGIDSLLAIVQMPSGMPVATITAFNGEKHDTILGKGVLNNKISSFFFELLKKEGVPTHFVRREDDRNQTVLALKIVPLEVIVRNIAAGSMAKRFGIEEGTPLKHPILEFCYKNDELGDPFANEFQITALGWATQEQLDVISTITLKVNDILKKFLATKNVTLVDFKVEFGTHNGEVLLGDEISPDTCRFWDATTGEKLDKDRFRRDLGNIEEAYKEMLFRLTGERA